MMLSTIRHIAESGDQIVVQVLGPAGNVVLPSGPKPMPWADAAFDLTFDE